MSSDHGSRKRPPERLANRYLVQQEIGSGATAFTYRGWDERLERSVAIKLLREHYAQDEIFVRRFEREARAAASVSHGNVVDVYDVGREGKTLYIVMQLIEGEDLKHLIQREAPLDRARVRSIAGQVLDGLGAIHAAGIIHRDIKPQNILIGRDGMARVTDFGIAQAEDDAGMTTEGTTVGTAAYMAPEQAQAGRLSEATDLYAVGVMLYEMVTGFLPFNAPTAVALMLEHIQTAPMPPSGRMPGRGIPASLDAVILRAMAKDPAHRFRSAKAMKEAVMRALDGAQGADSQATVAIPSVRPTRRPVPEPSRARRVESPSTRVPAQSVAVEGSGLGGVVAGFALILLLVIAAGVAWYVFDTWQNGSSSPGPTPVPTATVPVVVQPTAEVRPTATSEPEETVVVIEPVEPTEAPPVTETPEPTATEIPTVAPLPTATGEPALIEPIDGTPLSMRQISTPESKPARGNSEKNRQDEKNKTKNRDKNKDTKDDTKKKHKQGILVVQSTVLIAGEK